MQYSKVKEGHLQKKYCISDISWRNKIFYKDLSKMESSIWSNFETKICF